MTRVEELVEQVKALSPDDREAFDILLGDDYELELSDEWKAEIRRRWAELEAGTAKTVPWEEVRYRLRERIRAHKG